MVMRERPLALVTDQLARHRDACEAQRVATKKQIDVAKARNEELQQELRACEVDKQVAQKAVCDAHSRARATKVALALVEQQSAVAAAVLMHKEEQLMQCSECFRLLHQQTRELEEQQTALEDAMREASDLKSEVGRLRSDLSQQDVLRKQLEQARREAGSLQSVLENARTHASAALSERDSVRRNFDELRRRFVDMESEAAAFRSKASAASAGSKAAMAQLEDLRRELKNAEHSKNICLSELHTLRRQVDAARNGSLVTKEDKNALQQELLGLRKETNENDAKHTCASEGIDNLAIGSAIGHVDCQRGCADALPKSPFERVAAASSIETGSAKAQASEEVVKEVLDGALSEQRSSMQTVVTSRKILQSSPCKGEEQKSMQSYHTKSTDLIERRVLGADIAVMTNGAADPSKHASILHEGFEARYVERVTWALAESAQIENKRSSGYGMQQGNVQVSLRKQANHDPSDKSVCSAAKELLAQSKSTERSGKTSAQFVETSYSWLRDAPTAGERKLSSHFVPPTCGMMQLQYQQHVQQNSPQVPKRIAAQGCSLHSLQHKRPNSTRWLLGFDGVAKTRKRKRGCIKRDDLEKVGYTPGCGACRAAMNQEVQQHGHTDECRARVYQAMVRLNLPGARRLKDAEAWIESQDPKKRRICGSLTCDGGDKDARQQMPVSQSNGCAAAVARASARE